MSLQTLQKSTTAPYVWDKICQGNMSLKSVPQNQRLRGNILNSDYKQKDSVK